MSGRLSGLCPDGFGDVWSPLAGYVRTASVMSGHLSGLCSDGFGDVSGHLSGLCSDGLGDVRSPLGTMVRTAPTICLVTARDYVQATPAMSGRLGQRQLSVSTPRAIRSHPQVFPGLCRTT
ncbi:MAG: hypothetical protein PUJ95_02985 [Bacteroidales bacterium]|nr:hypothetical protein [Bacteroidales bacterium]